MSDITAAAEEAVAIARGEQAANRVYINGVFYVPEEKYAALTVRVEELKEEVCFFLSNISGAKLNKTQMAAMDRIRAAITKGESNG